MTDTSDVDVVVLVTEDRDADFLETKLVLEEDLGVDCELVQARTDDEALAAIDALAPRAVLMDINLQGSALDGIDLCQAIVDANPGRARPIEVVILTTSTNPSDLERARAAGARAYIEKLEGDAYVRALRVFAEVFISENYATEADLGHLRWMDPGLVLA